NSQNLLFTNGSIGIGTSVTPPDAALHVFGNGQIRAGSFRSGSGTDAIPAYRFTDDANSGMFLANSSELAFSTGGAEAMRIDASQNVGIGIAPTERLHVNGNILATGTITATGDITTNGNFIDTTTPDYVFQTYYTGKSYLNANYKFMSLTYIEKFTTKNHHLPGIKSASEIKRQGYWSLTEASQKNLEKIEELFLHTIEQEKKIQDLKSENDAMSKELQSLRKDLEEIKAMIKKE
ncbi:MAG: hypothetical protein ACKVJF_15185, partial [Flavobacteriales bacterium]